MNLETNKISEDELIKFNSLQDKYNQLITQFGSLYIEKLNLHTQLKQIEELYSAVEKEFEDFTEEEKAFALQIQNKYGSIELNSETGEYILQNS
jgi:hypothetical protein